MCVWPSRLLASWAGGRGPHRRTSKEAPLLGDEIALGFDKGPVFDRGLSTRRVPMDPGDRVLLAGTGAVRVIDHQGDEIGEKRLYKLFARNAPDIAEEALDGLLTALEAYADEEPFPVDVSVVVLGREASA